MISRDDIRPRFGRRVLGPVDVFVSYKHGSDSDLAAETVRRLRAAGFSVFYDQDIASGESIASVIDETIAKARVVLVLWSWSVKQNSDNVMGEIMAGKEAGTLLPVALDDAPLSTFFRALRVHRLATDRCIDERNFQILRRDIGERCGRVPVSLSEPTRPSLALPHPLPIPRQQPDSSVVRQQPKETDHRQLGRAVRSALAAIHAKGVWGWDEAPPRVVALAHELVTGTADDVLGVADLSLPGATRSLLLLFCDRFIYGNREKEVVITYPELIRSSVRLSNVGYGYRAAVHIDPLAKLDVRGQAQTSLLLETLHLLREELIWAA